MTKSKNILITGASTGIGFEMAKAFAGAGYQVYGSVRKQADAAKLREEVGENFHPLIFDVTNHLAIDEAAKKLTEKIGEEGLGGLINNAGVAIGGPFMDLDIEEFKHQFDVNVIGLIKVTQAFLPLLGARKNHNSEPGRIIQISSMAGKMSMPFMTPYSGSKHAVEGVSHGLRRELQLYGIDVVIIGLGHTKTPIWNKGAGEEREEKFKNSAFYKPLKIFQGVFVLGAIKAAWPAEVPAEKILHIFENVKPKTRYAMVPQKFKNWTLPRLLSDRKIDKMVKKALKLNKL